jgi:hypothetical protein
MLNRRILACLLTLSAIATTPAAASPTAPDYAAIVAAPDRSDADRRVKDRLDVRLKTPAAGNIVSVVRSFEDPAPREWMISIW